MPLASRMFAGDRRLEAAAVSPASHIVPGDAGPHVSKLQRALILLDNADMTSAELRQAHYGPATARAVLAYKTRRQIINRTYQSKPDDIVGIMTMASLDSEMRRLEISSRGNPGCGDNGSGPCAPARGAAHAMVAFGITAEGAAPAAPKKFPAELNVMMMWTTGALAQPTSRTWRYFEQASFFLRDFGITLNVLPSPREIPVNTDVIPGNKGYIWPVRKAAEKIMPGQPNVLRIIACPFEKTGVPVYAETQSGIFDGVEFTDFIMLNACEVRADQCTVLHEMLHAAKRADGGEPTLFDRWNHEAGGAEGGDNVYSTGKNRTFLRPEHAQALSEAFFARR